jgi:predicted RNA-binding protein Jag
MLPDIDILGKILKLRDEIDTIGQNLGSNIFQTLSDYLDADSNLEQAARNHIKAALARVKINDAKLKALWAKLEEELEDEIPEKLRPLLKSFAEFKAAKPGSVEWPLDYSKNYQPNSAINASFSASFNHTALLRAYPSPPEAVSELLPQDQAVLCINSSTELKANAQVAGDLDNGTFKFSSSGEASMALENYYRHEPADLFGMAVLESLATQPAAALTPLPLPFNDNVVAGHFIPHPSLLLSSFKRQGKLNSAAELGLSAPAAVAGGVISSLSLDLSASLQLEGSFRTRLSKLDTHTINVQVESLDKQQAEASLTANIGIDIKQQMGKVHSLLSVGLDKGKALVDRLQFDWSLSEEFVNSLGAELKKLGSGNDWNSLVDSLFSDQAAKDFIKQTKQDLDEQIDAVAEDVNTELSDYITAILEDAFEEIPLEARNKINNLVQGSDPIDSARSKVQELLSERSEAFIKALSNDTKGTVDKLIGQTNLAVFRPLVKRLEQVDNRVEKVRERVTSYLQNYLKQLQKLASISKALSENELKVAISMMRSKQSSDSKLIDMDFSHAACQQHGAAIDALLCGNPDAVIALAKVDTAGITVNECLFKHVMKTARQSGISVAVLDFKMESKCLLTEEVVFSENPVSGVITVGTKSSIKKSKDVYKDSRYIELVNLFQLSNAKQTGSGSIGITFNRQEDELDKRELERFLGSFHKAGLLSSEQLSTATARAFQDSDTLVEQAELVAGLRWDKTQLARLLEKNRQPTFKDLLSEVTTEMDAMQVIRESHLKRLERDIRMDLKVRGVEFDESRPGAVLSYFTSDGLINLFKQMQQRDAGLGSTSASAVRKLAKWYELALDLHQALNLMSEVYYSGGELDKDQYHELSEEINDAFRDWIKSASLLEMAWSLLPFTDNSKDDEVKASMLALLKILNRLAAGPDSEQSALSITMTVGEGNKKKITTLV